MNGGSTNERHEQVWVKVNAPVDRGIARVVEILNRVPSLRTIDSCEGICGSKPAHIYFNYGNWKQIGELLFQHIGPALWGHFGADAVVSLEVFNNSEPMGKLSFDKEATNEVASILDTVL